MPDDDVVRDKQYIDRSVQTSPTCAQRLNRQPENLEVKDERVVTDNFSVVLSSLQCLDISDKTVITYPAEEQDIVTKLPSINTTTRSLKRQHLSYRRPTSNSTKSGSARIISLPETAPAYSEQKSLRQTVKLRAVSMPEKTERRMHSVDHSLSSDQSQGSILPDSDAPARIRVHSSATDAPHTPSPPSSPDSVVIIGSHPQISERFLQGDSCTDISSPSIDDDFDNDDGNVHVSFREIT